MAAWSATRGRRSTTGRIVMVAAVVIGVAVAGVAVAWSGGADTAPAATPPDDPVAGGAAEQPTDEPTVQPTMEPVDPHRARKEAAGTAVVDTAERQRAAEEARRAAEEARQAEEARRQAEEARRQAEEEARRKEQARVTAFQQRLRDLGYLVGPVDGAKGQQTTAAVMAFQAVNGLAVDGVVGPQTRAALDDPPAAPQLRGGAGTRIEVDLDRQVLHLVEDGAHVVTMKVSSGNGEQYDRPDGSRGIALTPVGRFTIQRRISGVHESTAGLGTMYDPMYFLGGFAVHGSGNVPAGPASHGCVRLSRADARWLFDRVPNGTPVLVHGGQHTFSP